jgi:putative membrane protein
VALEHAEKTTAGPDQMQLALERTFLAHERTLMAWIRTAASLITFGFTLYKFFEFLHEREPGTAPQGPLTARTYGMVMIVVGIVTLALATWQHRVSVKRLRLQYREEPFSLALLVAAFISGLGLLALAATIFRG